MAASPELKKKTGTEQIAQIINSILEEASRSRGGFTPQTIQGFYKEGLEAREQTLSSIKPSRQLGNMVATKKDEKEKPQITVKVGEKAIEASVNLAERFELAAAGKKLDLKSWVISK
jgi:hypothetical protein